MNPILLLLNHPHFPRLKDPGYRQFAELWKPTAQVITIRIIILCLFFHVKGPEGNSIISDSGRIQPVAVVAAYIIIDELGFKPGGPDPPVQPQVFREKAGHVLTRRLDMNPVCFNSRMPASTSG